MYVCIYMLLSMAMLIGVNEYILVHILVYIYIVCL